VVVPQVDIPLTEVGFQQLSEINVLRESHDMGVNIFIEVLNVVQQNKIQ
jgi:hypothetical protein